MPAEQLVGEARARRARGLPRQEAVVRGTSAAAYAAVALAIALLLPSEREASALGIGALVLAYALVSRVRFEFGIGYVVPEQLVLIPMLALAPLPLVPALVALAALLSVVPDVLKGAWHWDRTITSIGDSWFVIGPVLVLAAFAPGKPTLGHADDYALAFGAQLVGEVTWAWVRERLDKGPSLKEQLAEFAGAAKVDAALTPLAFLVAVAAAQEPLSVCALAPLVWLLDLFSKDRRERFAAALELHRAYRGTVMLLADVIDYEDRYTGDHSRSVVELVHGVADQLKMPPGVRQELEFAALLHDVGKIAIPKEILNKPSSLTDEEFEIMKTHTIEGQFMLDRVGGLLARVGEIVRSCHERWDGTGYPDSLVGHEIPLEARIVFVCDAFNAMTTDRPYRAAMSAEAAVAELVANAGKQFDPLVVDAFVRALAQGLRQPATDQVRAILATSKAVQGAGAPT